MEPMPLTSLPFGASSIPVIAVPDDLDLASAPVVREAVVKALEGGTTAGVVIDMRNVGFVDSRGMAELLAVRKLVRGQPVRLLGVRETVLEAMQLLGIDILFTLFDDLDELRNSLRPTP